MAEKAVLKFLAQFEAGGPLVIAHCRYNYYRSIMSVFDSSKLLNTTLKMPFLPRQSRSPKASSSASSTNRGAGCQ